MIWHSLLGSWESTQLSRIALSYRLKLPVCILNSMAFICQIINHFLNSFMKTIHRKSYPAQQKQTIWKLILSIVHHIPHHTPRHWGSTSWHDVHRKHTSQRYLQRLPGDNQMRNESTTPLTHPKSQMTRLGRQNSSKTFKLFTCAKYLLRLWIGSWRWPSLTALCLLYQEGLQTSIYLEGKKTQGF